MFTLHELHICYLCKHKWNILSCGNSFYEHLSNNVVFILPSCAQNYYMPYISPVWCLRGEGLRGGDTYQHTWYGAPVKILHKWPYLSWIKYICDFLNHTHIYKTSNIVHAYEMPKWEVTSTSHVSDPYSISAQPIKHHELPGYKTHTQHWVDSGDNSRPLDELYSVWWLGIDSCKEHIDSTRPGHVVSLPPCQFPDFLQVPGWSRLHSQSGKTP